LAQQYRSDVPIRVSGAYRLGDIRHNYADNAKASRLLGFRPKVNFSEGIARFAKWVQEQAVPKDTFDKSLDEMKARGLFKT
jgi:dTDP-L-rhamnose 4-epimerase